jgi:hypothetical protein
MDCTSRPRVGCSAQGDHLQNAREAPTGHVAARARQALVDIMSKSAFIIHIPHLQQQVRYTFAIGSALFVRCTLAREAKWKPGPLQRFYTL